MKKNKKFKIGKKTYSKAKKIILNGNMQISKNPEQFLGNNWPNYFLKTKEYLIFFISLIHNFAKVEVESSNFFAQCNF